LIAAALQTDGAMVLPVLAEPISEQFDAQRERYKSELRERERELQLSISRLEGAERAADGAERRAQQNNRLAECVAGRELSPLLRPLQSDTRRRFRLFRERNRVSLS